MTQPARPAAGGLAAVLDSRLVEWFIIACYAYFFLIILFEVVARYVFSYSTTWGEMTARYAHVYFAYLAAAEAFRHDGHIRIDYLADRLPQRWRLALESYIDALCLGLALAVVWFSIRVVDLQLNAGFRMQALPLNMAFATAAIPLGWALMAIRLLQRLRRRFTGRAPAGTLAA